MNKPKIIPVNLSLPEKLLEDFDKAWQKNGHYKDRSDAVEHLIREFIQKEA